MSTILKEYSEIWSWLNGKAGKNGPHLLLGNGFSVAYDPKIFSYDALLNQARKSDSIDEFADRIFKQLSTYDFESVIKYLLTAAEALTIIDEERHDAEIHELSTAASSLKEVLARTLADLHPARPKDISDAAYERVAQFAGAFNHIYTANYDLLLYWTIMRDTERSKFDVSDDGFRGARDEADYVVWNRLKPHRQTIYYLHGALHLYRDEIRAQTKKLTWSRTGEALIDQIREQLASENYPLIITEGSATEKLAKIQTSDYLARGLRSLAAVGGSMLVYGLSFSDNDSHITEALVKSRIKRLAVSLYGDPNSDANRETVKQVTSLVSQRASEENFPLEVSYFDASAVELWND